MVPGFQSQDVKDARIRGQLRQPLFDRIEVGGIFPVNRVNQTSTVKGFKSADDQVPVMGQIILGQQ